MTKQPRAVVHFYHEEFIKCKILDRHLSEIALKHPEAAFLKLDARKAPFFVEKLAIRVLPCLCVFLNGILKDKILGFQEIGTADSVQTIALVRKLVVLKAIDELPEERFKIRHGTAPQEDDDDLGID